MRRFFLVGFLTLSMIGGVTASSVTFDAQQGWSAAGFNGTATDKPVIKYRNGSVGDGLIGYWRLDKISGAVTDYSGEDNDGNPMNGVDRGVQGVLGTNAFDFDGVDDAVAIPSTPPDEFDADQVTVSAWVKPADLSGGVRRVFQRDSATYGMYQYYNEINFYVDTSDDGGDWEKIMYVMSSNDTNKWAYYVGTYDGTSMRLYRNGELVATTSKSGVIDDANDDADNNAYIGSAEFSQNYFNGSIDEVRIYNRSLTQEEIKEQYLYSKPNYLEVGQQSGGNSLLGHYRFSGFTGSVQDDSGNGNDANLQGTSVQRGVSGVFGTHAFAFPKSTSQYVSLPDTTRPTGSNPFTISFWFKMDQVPSQAGTMSLLAGKELYGPLGRGGVALSIYDGDGRMYYDLYGDDTRAHAASPDPGWQADRWYHVAMVWDGSTDPDGQDLWLDGRKVADQGDEGISGLNWSGTNRWGIGAGVNYGFDGKIDDLRIFNRAISPERIRALALNPSLQNNDLNYHQEFVGQRIDTGKQQSWDALHTTLNLEPSGTDVTATVYALDSTGNIVDRQTVDLVPGSRNYSLSLQSSEDAALQINGLTETPVQNWYLSEATVYHSPSLCAPPNSGDWIIQQDCTIDTAVSVPANMEIRSNAVVNVTETGSIDLDLQNNNLLVRAGSTLLIDSQAQLH